MKIEIVSDVICPWCYIGKRRLEKALALIPELKPEIHWLPFQLNPDMPREGVARAEYRKAKFGSVERGRQLDARVAAEGKGVGHRLPLRPQVRRLGRASAGVARRSDPRSGG